MACTIEVISDEFGDDDWGIGEEQGGFTATTSVSITERCEKAEGKDAKGCIVAIAFYNKTSEISIEGIGANPDDQVAGEKITLSNEEPAASRTSIKFFITWWVCSSISPETSFELSFFKVGI